MKSRSPVKVPRLAQVRGLTRNGDSSGACYIHRVVPPMVPVIKRRIDSMFGIARRKRPLTTRDMCEDCWILSERHRSPEVQLLTPTHVLFHPNWSNGHAGCRADRPLSRHCRHYWEVAFLGERVFGTAMQVGLATSAAPLHADRFLPNLLGQDEHSWGISHKGLAWHQGQSHKVCAAFCENQATRLGLLFDGPAGTLSIFKDDEPLGIVFNGLDQVQDDLYPALSSTAAKTSMSIVLRRRSFTNLQDRCRAVLARIAPTPALTNALPLPLSLRRLLLESLPRLPGAAA